MQDKQLITKENDETIKVSTSLDTANEDKVKNENERFPVNTNDAATSVSSVHDDTEKSVCAAPVPSVQDTESASPCLMDLCIEQRNTELEDHHVAGSRGGLVNTPASFLTDWSEYKAGRSQHVPSGSKEAMYQRALTLMSERCTSTTANADSEQSPPLIQVDDPPINLQGPRVFFVKQSRPVPMPPLKAWRGYHGNVYFEPIKVAPAPTETSPLTHQPEFDNCSEPLHKLLHRRANARSGCSSTTQRTSSLNAHLGANDVRMRSAFSESVPSKAHLYGSTSASMKRTSKSAPSSYMRKMAILDKRSVFQKCNSYIHEDVDWILAQESTGSLCIMPPKRGNSDPRLKWNRERICKGSVAHQIYSNKNGCSPLLLVNGNRKSYKTDTSKTHQQSLNEFPDLSRDKFADDDKSDFHHVIPSLEKMNLNEDPSQQSNVPL